MGLISAIKSRLFPPELCRVAKVGDPTAVAGCLNRITVVVVGSELGAAIPFDADQQNAINAIQSAATNKAFDGILKYEIEGDRFLPIFTDQVAAESFCGAYCSLLGHVHAYRLFTIPGHYIRRSIDNDDFIVVNPQCGNEAEIECSKSATIRDELADTDTLEEAQFLSLAVPMVGVSDTIEFAPD